MRADFWELLDRGEGVGGGWRAQAQLDLIAEVMRQEPDSRRYLGAGWSASFGVLLRRAIWPMLPLKKLEATVTLYLSHQGVAYEGRTYDAHRMLWHLRNGVCSTREHRRLLLN